MLNQIGQEHSSSNGIKPSSNTRHPRQKSECSFLHCIPHKSEMEMVSLAKLNLENTLLGLNGPSRWTSSRLTLDCEPPILICGGSE